MSVTTSSAPLAAGAPSLVEVMAQAPSENFPVASYLLGRRQRMHLMAIYGFARFVDDIGDEATGDRLALLDWVEGELDRLYSGTEPEHPVMRKLTPTVADCHLPDGPFRRLIEANRRDQSISRYETFEDLLDYCQLSAAPVGELVLHVFGAGTPERIALSDHVCAGLQVTEHLQDVVEDYAKGRIYLPWRDMERFGCEEKEAGREDRSDAWRALMSFEAQRARALLGAGVTLARSLPLRPRLAIAGFVAGGRSALDALESSHLPPGGAQHGLRKGSFARNWLKAVSGR